MSLPAGALRVSDKEVNLEAAKATLSYSVPVTRLCSKWENIPRACSDPDTLVIPSRSHPFVDAISSAYNQHLVLRLRPDDIWLVIAQGIATHINAPGNAEAFRHKFVAHEGLKELTVQMVAIDWPVFVESICQLAEGSMKDATLLQALKCDFSTTTATSSTASRIVIMNAMKAYFSYKCYLLCGIPGVILDGTPEDYQRIIDKVNQVESLGLGLDWWFDELKPVLQQLLNTAKGQADRYFWGRPVVHESGGSGPSYIHGWVNCFFPYSADGKQKRMPVTAKLDADEFPSGLTAAPFKLDDNGVEYAMQLDAGFLGCHVDQEEGIVSPHIGWLAGPDRDWVREKVQAKYDAGEYDD